MSTYRELQAICKELKKDHPEIKCNAKGDQLKAWIAEFAPDMRFEDIRSTGETGKASNAEKKEQPLKKNEVRTAEEAVEKYREHILQKIKEDPKTYNLEALRGQVLGCWCKSVKDPQPCHADVLIELLEETAQGPQTRSQETTAVSVKVADIRPKYNNLIEWMENPKHTYVGRKGVVFINNKETGKKERHPKEDSIWHNPFKVKKEK